MIKSSHDDQDVLAAGNGTLYRFKKGLYILFDKPISSVTAGQFVSWYINDELIGSGIIN